MQEQAYQKLEISMSAAKANLYALVIVLPILLIFIPVYVLVWTEQFSLQNMRAFAQAYHTMFWLGFLIFMGVFIIGAVVHELLHGLTWAASCKRGTKSIKYGVHWKALAPYCHCEEVLPLKAYIIGGMMPGLIMGVLPALAGIIWGNMWVFFFGIFFTVAAAGDILVLWLLRHCHATDLVQDHPGKIGCYIMRRDYNI